MVSFSKAKVGRLNTLNKGRRMRTIAVIPARGGSKGVPKKNIKELAGYPLICYSINTAMQIFGRVYVSTDCSEIAKVARAYGAKIINRPSELASDTATDFDWLSHAFREVECENIAIFRPTTPLRCASTVVEGIARFEKMECTSMRSAHEAPESPLKWFSLFGEHWLMNMNADKPRQSLPTLFIPNGYLDITKRKTIEKGSAFGNDILSFKTEPVVEVDTQEEFDYLEYIIRRNHEERIGLAVMPNLSNS